MIVEKWGFLQRVRTVLTALVVLAGLGTTLMSMKPVTNDPEYKYGVAITANGMNYQILSNVTQASGDPYICASAPSVTCTVLFDEDLSSGSKIVKADTWGRTSGLFQQ